MKHIAFVEASSTGAGALINLIAKRRGYHVTLLTRSPESQPQDVLQNCDSIIHCETNDFDVALQCVEEVNRKKQIDAVTTTADWYVPLTATICQNLGLPGMSLEAAVSARNKYRMRCILERTCPEYNPGFALAANENEALAAIQGWTFPFVAKPQNADAGEYVELIGSQDALCAYLHKAQSWDTNTAGQPMEREVLLEEYVSGEEYSIETLQAKGGSIQLIGVTRKHLIGQERGYFVESGHAFPVSSVVAERLFEATSRILDALSIDCGVIHTECRLTENGDVKVMEVNPRLAGGKIGSHLIELATGRSAVEAIIDIALGEQVVWRTPRHEAAAVTYLWSDRAGVFQGIINRDELLSLPGIVDVMAIAKVGCQTAPPQSNKDRLGVVLSRAADAEQAYAYAREAASRARFLKE